MEIRQLKYFVGIAETGKFSETSKQMYISQSAVSQQIKALEAELGTELFVRNNHDVRLTDSGRELLPLARNVIKSVAECTDRINSLKGLLCGELNVGLTYTMEPYMRPAMIEFMKKYPDVQLNAHYKNLPELLKKLHDNDIDMMLSMMPTSDHEFCESEPLMEYQLCAIMRKQNTLAGKKTLSFKDLSKQSLILPERGIRDRNAIESYIHAKTGNLKIRSLINDPNAILNIVQETNMICILAKNTIKNRPDLCSVDIDELSTPVKIYCHFNKYRGRKHSAQIFLDIIKNTQEMYIQKSNINK